MLENGSRVRIFKQRFAAVRPLLLMAVFSFLFLAVASAAPVFAQGPDPAGLEAVGSASGLGASADIFTIIGRIINVALGFIGILLLGMLLYAGYLWMTSGGKMEQVEQAKMMIRNAMIGLLIIVSSFAIVNFILAQLAGVTGFGGGGTGPFGGGPSGFPGSAGALGGGIIEMHLPQRDATGVPRNTPIVITFKEPIRVDSFIKDWTEATSGTVTGLNDDVIKIYASSSRSSALTSAQASVRYTADRKTFVIRPVDYLGNPTSNTDYTAELIGGRTGVILADGTSALGSTGYRWQFQVSTLIDNTPPRITAVIPSDRGRFAPNIVVQINFNEPVDPTASAGVWDGAGGFSNIEVRATPASGVGAETRPSGEFRISNGYRTVEFTTDLACGTNSCGSTVYCLPSDSSIAVIAKAPTLSDTPPMAFLFGSSGYDGITDMVGNALDGNGDGDAQGSDGDSTPGNDDYGWTFGTLTDPDLTAPRIESTDPIAGDLIDSSNQPLDHNPVASFDSVLQSSTVNSDTVEIQSNEPSSMADTWWYSLSQDPLTAAGVVAGVGDIATKGRLTIDHRLYSPASSTLPGAVVPTYQPIVHSGVQNIYQNCFNPAASADCSANSTNPNCCGNPGNIPQSGACSDLTPTP